MGATQKAVTFRLPNGEVVSNDPRHYEDEMAKRIIANHVATEKYRAEAKGDTKSAPADVELEDDESTTEPTGPVEAAEDLNEMTGEDLKTEVARLHELGVEVKTKGVKTKAELAAAITTAVEAHNAEAE